VEAASRLVEGVIRASAAEPAPRLGERLFGSEATPNELVDALLDVKADLVVHLLARSIVGARPEAKKRRKRRRLLIVTRSQGHDAAGASRAVRMSVTVPA
jgi:hypothetical protein